MTENIAKQLMDSVRFEIDNLSVRPKAVMVSPEFHKRNGQQTYINGIKTLVDIGATQHYSFKF